MSFASTFVKFSFTVLDFLRDIGLQAPDDIYAFKDIRYSNHREYQLLDLYMSKEFRNKLNAECAQSTKESNIQVRVQSQVQNQIQNRVQNQEPIQNPIQQPKLPVIINIHGGGWVYGTKESYKFYCMRLAQNGYIVINFNYGLAPRYQFPIQLEDIDLVFQWLLSNANLYGMDLSNIYGVADSAGANLLATYCNLLNSEEYKIEFKNTIFDRIENFDEIRILGFSAIALNCGFYQVDNSDITPWIIRRLAKDYAFHKADSDFLNLISPIRYLNQEFPPVFLSTSTGDFLRNQSETFAKSLSEHLLEHEFKLYGTKVNRLPHVFHLNTRNKDAKRCMADMLSFFQKHYKKGYVHVHS